jgi:FtsZ-binding cell division protein ZapB
MNQLKGEQLMITSLKSSLDEQKRNNVLINAKCEKLDKRNDMLEEELKKEKNNQSKWEERINDLVKDRAEMNERIIKEK